jgi:hypothetical protein
VWRESVDLRNRMYFPAAVACTGANSDVVSTVACAFKLSDPTQSSSGPQDMSRHPCDAQKVSLGTNVCYLFNVHGTAYSVSNGFLELDFTLNATDPARLLIRLINAADLTRSTVNDTLYTGLAHWLVP